MSASSVIGDVTETLQSLLVGRQAPQRTFDVSLKSPAEETIVASMKPVVNLFLFRVVENADRKNQPWQPRGPFTLQYPPLTLDLFYVLTPFAEDKVDEHKVLGEAMRILYDNAIIDPADLQGSLAHSGEEIKVDLCQFDVEDLTRIWNALSKPYRLSVCYQVRIVDIDSLIERPSRRVVEKRHRFGRNQEEGDFGL